jgi:adenylylsulfate kinase
MVIWITGLPGSGKSSVAEAFKKRHPEFHILRMDDLRRVATPRPTYSEVERDLLYRSLVFMAMFLSALGHSVIIDATGNRRRWRGLARKIMPGFAEVWLRCPARVCEAREAKRRWRRGAPKGIYEKAKKGWPVPGVVVPYERPLKPELVIDTDKTGIEEAALIVEGLLEKPKRVRLK